MDSAPKISDSVGQASSSIPGEFGRTLARRTSPQVTVIRRAIVQPGFIARRSVAFGSYVGQSQVTRCNKIDQQVVAAVFDLHANALQFFLHLWYIEQPKVDGLFHSEHFSTQNHRDQRVGNATCATSD